MANLKVWEIISVSLSAIVGGMYWGPWLALTKSMRGFRPEVFLDIVRQMNRNMKPLMSFLTPVALLSLVPVILMSYKPIRVRGLATSCSRDQEL
jgi:hypothetical protein